MTSESTDFNEIIIPIIYRAGEIINKAMAEHRNILATTKSTALDLVTETDKEVEKMIVGELSGHFPGWTFFGEEFPIVQGESDGTFFIDPIDGTTNFVHSHPFHAISIGVQRSGTLLAGFVYAPRLDLLFSSELGKGAWLNGEPIHVSSIDRIDKSLLATEFACIRKDPGYRGSLDFIGNLLGNSHGFRRSGSAALDLCFVAAGWIDCYWEQCLGPWDIAAGTSIVREAGGLVSDFDGAENILDKSTILASNAALHHIVLDKLRTIKRIA